MRGSTQLNRPSTQNERFIIDRVRGKSTDGQRAQRKVRSPLLTSTSKHTHKRTNAQRKHRRTPLPFLAEAVDSMLFCMSLIPLRMLLSENIMTDRQDSPWSPRPHLCQSTWYIGSVTIHRRSYISPVLRQYYSTHPPSYTQARTTKVEMCVVVGASCMCLWVQWFSCDGGRGTRRERVNR